MTDFYVKLFLDGMHEGFNEEMMAVAEMLGGQYQSGSDVDGWYSAGYFPEKQSALDFHSEFAFGPWVNKTQCGLIGDRKDREGFGVDDVVQQKP